MIERKAVDGEFDRIDRRTRSIPLRAIAVPLDRRKIVVRRTTIVTGECISAFKYCSAEYNAEVKIKNFRHLNQFHLDLLQICRIMRMFRENRFEADNPGRFGARFDGRERRAVFVFQNWTWVL